MVDEPEVEPQDGEPEINPLAFNVPIGPATGAIGLGPYGDVSEYTGPPEVIVYTPPYRPFFATDARSVMVTLLPQHYNLIPNPAFRVDGAGWIATGIEPAPTSFSWRVANTSAQAALTAITANTGSTAVDPDPAVAPDYVNGQLVKVVTTLAANVTVAWLKIDNAATLTVAQAAAVGITIGAPVPKYRVYNPMTDSLDASESWVGKSLMTYGTGMLRYRAGTDKFVYVGPLDGTQENQWDFRRGGPEYTFSVYVKGAGDVRLTMDGYESLDRMDLSSGPQYQNLVSTVDPATYPVGQPAVIDSNTGRVWTPVENASTQGGNLLTPNQASVETDTTGFTPGPTYTTLARSTAQAAVGVASLAATRITSAGPIYVGTVQLNSVVGGVPVTPGQTYTVTASFRAATTPRNIQIALDWRTAAGASAGGLTQSVSTAGETTSGWFTITHSGSAPLNAAVAGVYMTVLAAGINEVHYIDKIGFMAGTRSSPAYEDIGRGPAIATSNGEWTPIEDDGDWQRVVLKTRAWVGENEGQIEFTGAWWIDAKIEVRNANSLRISAVMLDPNEYPTAAYFDGGMTESLYLDDFLWEGADDASPSYYYFDRVVRAKWLHERLAFVTPAGRPHQIFFGSYWRPYVGKTGKTIIMDAEAQTLLRKARSDTP